MTIEQAQSNFENYEVSDLDLREELKGFIIDNDQKAEWAIKKISAIDREAQRLIEICDAEIDRYEFKKAGYEEKRVRDRAGLLNMLLQYFETAKTKSTKTQATYILPSGKLIKKLEKLDFRHDEKKLIESLKGTEYVQFKPNLKWKELKNNLEISGDVAVDKTTGEIIDGVTIIVKPATFDVKIN